MAKKAKSGSGIDRQIAAKRKAISAINKKKSAEKARKRKLAALAKLDNKLKALKKRTKR